MTIPSIIRLLLLASWTLLISGCGDSPVAAPPEPIPLPALPGIQPVDDGRKLLAHRRNDGSSLAYVIGLEAAPPLIPPLDTRTRVQEEARVLPDGSFRCQSVLNLSGRGLREARATGSYRVSPTGKLRDLASSQLGEEFAGPFVRNVPLIYLPLPGQRVAVGETWTGEFTLFMPPLNVPFEVPPVKAHARCTFEKLLQTPEGEVARIKALAKAAPGQTLQATLLGFYDVDVEAGHIIQGQLTGDVEAAQLMVPWSFPVTITLQLQPEGEAQ